MTTTSQTDVVGLLSIDDIERILRERMYRTSRIYSVRTGQRKFGVGGHRDAARALIAALSAPLPAPQVPDKVGDGAVCPTCKNVHPEFCSDAFHIAAVVGGQKLSADTVRAWKAETEHPRRMQSALSEYCPEEFIQLADAYLALIEKKPP